MKYSAIGLGLNIRNNRKKRNLSIEQLAELLEVSSSFLGLVERGQRGLALDKICKLVDIYGISLDELFYGKATTKNLSTALKLSEPSTKRNSRNLAKLESLVYSLTEDELNIVIALVVAMRKYRKSNPDDEQNKQGGPKTYHY